MNKQQRPEHAAYFARQWLEEILTQCRRVKGLLHHLRTVGHLNPRYTKPNNGVMLDVETLLRIEVNMAMEQDREIFMAQWNKLGVIIYDFANEQGDDFNKLYERKERQQERRGST